MALSRMYKSCGPALFSEQMLWILRKNPEPGERDILPKGNVMWNRRLVPFRHNRIQLDLDKNLGNRNICLKPRQGGYTTYMILMRLLLQCILNPGAGGLLISQNHTYAALHFAILQRGWRYFGVKNPYDNTQNPLSDMLHRHLLHTRASNRREIIFDAIDSRIVIDSAEVPEAGQGLTINHAVCTEVARWPGNPEETMANMKEAIPLDGTLDLESTANGWGGYFFEECMRARQSREGAETEFKYFFHEWWWHDEYRADPPAKKESLTEEESRLIEVKDLDLHQIRWRRLKIMSLRHNFAEKYPEDDLSCFLLQGASFFDKEVLKERMLEVQLEKPVVKKKKITIYKQRNRAKRYVIAADVATGKNAIVVKGANIGDKPDDLDWSAAVVIDIETGEEVAWYHAHISEEEYAWDLAELARLYNDALVAVERTGAGGTVVVTLEGMCMYPNIYKHKEWWKRDKTKVIEFPGFPTTGRTRPVALNRIRNVVSTSPELIHDIGFIEEAMVFVRNEKGIPAASPGSHDDRVMCRAIGHYVRAVLLGYLDPLSAPSESYRDETEDELTEQDFQETE
jgi:hypothetical protein